jgi:hypothetical protein
MRRDAGIQWIRDTRGVISKELHNDPGEFVEFHRKLRSRYSGISEQAHPVDRTQPPASRPSAPGD